MVWKGTNRPRISFVEAGHLSHLQKIAGALAMTDPLELEANASRGSCSPPSRHRVDKLDVREVAIYTGSCDGEPTRPDYRIIYRSVDKDKPICHVDLTFDEAESAYRELRRREREARLNPTL